MLGNNQLFGDSGDLNPKSSSTFISSSSINSNHQRSNLRHSTNSLAAAKSQSNPVQIQNYITWINSHLKKRPGVKLVEHLHTDLANGVSLIHLIEVISGTVLADVNLNPKTQSECRENIEKILKFMQQNSVKMHQTSAKEILDGNLKSIMRLVLALAAHFKPTNVQPYSAFMSKLNQNPSSQTSSSTNLNTLSNKQMTNKRSQSTNNVNSMNNTYVVNNQQSASSASKPTLNQTRNLDSMTHLVQAACVSLADVRKYKNENFNIKYVKRGNLTDCNSTYLNPINLNSNQTYILPNMNTTNYIDKTCNQFSPPKNSTMITGSFLLSPNAAQPIASSTVLQPVGNALDSTAISMDRSGIYNLKSVKNKTYYLDKKERIIEEEVEMKSPVKKSTEDRHLEAVDNCSKSTENVSNNQTAKTVVNEANEANAEAKNILEVVKDSDSNSMILQNMVENNEINITEVQSIKNMLLNLQKVLITCDMSDLQPEDLMPNAENELNSSNVSNPSNLPYEEKISILKSEIQQLEVYNTELKNELNQFKTDNLNKNGIQSGLKSRISEQNNTILEMKNEQLNLELNTQNLTKEKDDLKNQLISYQTQIESFKTDLANKDSLIEKLKSEISDLTREKEEQAKVIRQQVKKVSDTLDVVQEKEHALSGMIANTDRKINLIASQNAKKDLTVSASKEEYSTIKDSLGRLRHQFGHNHSSQVLINMIEQNLNSLIERTGLNPALFSSSTSGSSSLTSSSANSPVQHVQSQSPSSVHSSSSSISAVSNYSHKSLEKTEIEAKSESTNNESNVKKIISRLFAQTYTAPQGVHPNGNLSARTEKPNKLNNQMWENFCKQKSASSLLTISTSTNFDSTQSSANTSTSSCNNSAIPSTKCVYYMEKNNSPIMIHLNKNLGSITLNDLKEAVKLKQSGNYRYRFKLTDREFGVITQEISDESKILPSFDGKIVVWIEKM
ncbi:dixin isoform X4 [Brachionus plicatilis]|uniref:Dixin isoform X4 n=1 Tax=Brachionus plicatilis TaxID=10195 RepID=A0A3M7PIL2_BRAPC|nr:dixin isoform X4 [Brachionus plicatilis]